MMPMVRQVNIGGLMLLEDLLRIEKVSFAFIPQNTEIEKKKRASI